MVMLRSYDQPLSDASLIACLHCVAIQDAMRAAQITAVK